MPETLFDGGTARLLVFLHAAAAIVLVGAVVALVLPGRETATELEEGVSESTTAR